MTQGWNNFLNMAKSGGKTVAEYTPYIGDTIDIGEGIYQATHGHPWLGSGQAILGGAGLAAPPLIWSLINPVTSFAIICCYSLVTCVKLSSKSVFLPKIMTMTLSLLLSSTISSTVPSNPLKGPSVIFTASPAL